MKMSGQFLRRAVRTHWAAAIVPIVFLSAAWIAYGLKSSLLEPVREEGRLVRIAAEHCDAVAAFDDALKRTTGPVEYLVVGGVAYTVTQQRLQLAADMRRLQAWRDRSERCDEGSRMAQDYVFLDGQLVELSSPNIWEFYERNEWDGCPSRVKDENESDWYSEFELDWQVDTQRLDSLCSRVERSERLLMMLLAGAAVSVVILAVRVHVSERQHANDEERE